jgi:hypothetical protein
MIKGLTLIGISSGTLISLGTWGLAKKHLTRVMIVEEIHSSLATKQCLGQNVIRR